MSSPRARATALASVLLVGIVAGFCVPLARATDVSAVGIDSPFPPLWVEPATTPVHGRMIASRAPAPFVAQSLPEDAVWEGFLTPANHSNNPLFVEYHGKLVLESEGVAGPLLTQGLVTWDGTKFEALPALFGYVSALGVWNDHVIAATQTYPPWQVAILQLDGAVWDTLGHANDYVWKFGEFQGHLIAAGRFTAVDGVPSSRVVAFDGSSWSNAGTGLSGSEVTGLTIHLGRLVAGGNITPAPGVVSLDTLGGAWQPVGTGFGGGVKDVLSDGVDLYASGRISNSNFTATLGALMRWNGTAWSGTGSLTNLGTDHVYMTRWNGKIVASMPVSFGPGAVGALAQWDGVSLTHIPGDSLNATPLFIGTWGTKLVATGPALNGSVPIPRIATYDGTQWGTVQGAWGPGMHGTTGSISDMRSWGGKLIVAGLFALFADQDHWSVDWRIAAWDGTHWSPLGGGINGEYFVLGEYAGDLVVAGYSISVRGLPITTAARWNGVSWSALGTGAPGDVETIAEFQNQLYMGSDFQGLWHWNNSTWSSVPALDGWTVSAVATSGLRLVVGGDFPQYGAIGSPNVVFWDGANLQPAGAGVNSNVYAATEWLGQPVIGGGFTASGDTPLPGVATWDGSQWQPMGTRAVRVYQLRVQEGELFASGDFRLPDDSVVETIAHWTGTDWHVLGSGSNQYPFATYGGYLYQAGSGLEHGHASHGLARMPLGAILDVPRPQSVTGHVALAVRQNPVRGRAHFVITLPAAAHARLTVHDVAGRLLATLNDGELTAGEHQFEWAAAGAEPAVYFIRLVTPSLHESRRFVLLRP